jgi:hypothetical protein
MYKGYLLPLLNKGPENGVLKRDSIVTEKKKGGKGIRGDTAADGFIRLHTGGVDSKMGKSDKAARAAKPVLAEKPKPNTQTTIH